MPVDRNPVPALARGLAGAGAAALLKDTTGLNSPIMGPFRKGMRNDGVRLVQQRLNEVLAGTPGFVRLGPDGAFGGKTEAAVVRFQKAGQLRADGVVGPITAKALGFTQYTSLQRLGAGAMQLASVITGSLARLVPAPHTEPDLAYNALVALAVQAQVMRRALGVLGTVPGTAGAVRELDQIAAGLQQKLASAKLVRGFVNGARQERAYADSMQGRLLALSRQLQTLAKPQQPKPGTLDSSVLKLLALQAQLLGMQARIMGSAYAVQPRPDAADEVLKIAANVFNSANRMLPRL